MSLWSKISERMCEQIWIIEEPKISSQEGVALWSKSSERMCEQIRAVEMTKIS